MSTTLEKIPYTFALKRRLLRLAGAGAISLVLITIFFGSACEGPAEVNTEVETEADLSGSEWAITLGPPLDTTTTTEAPEPLTVFSTNWGADLHNSEVWIPPVPSLPEGITFEPLDDDILLASYTYNEQSDEVRELQEVVGADPDGHYGPQTREAHIRALDENDLDDSHVPDVPVYTPPTDVVYEPGVEQWRPWVTEAVFAFGGDEADVTRFLRIMHCESRGIPTAKNPNSSASGLMQHLTKYWPARAEAVGMPGADVFDPWANIYVSAWLALAAPGGGWQHWVCK